MDVLETMDTNKTQVTLHCISWYVKGVYLNTYMSGRHEVCNSILLGKVSQMFMCTFKIYNFKIWTLLLTNFEALSFFSRFMENESERGTNKSCEPRKSSRVICSFFFCAQIHSPWTQKKDTHSLYWQHFQQRPFLKFSEKSYKFKILTVTGTSHHFMYWSLRMWFSQLPNYFLTVVIGNRIEI